MKKARQAALLIPATILAAILTLSESSAKDLGIVGATYSVDEPDALEEIREKAAGVDWGKVFDKRKWRERIEHFRPGNRASLPPAQENRVFLPDMSYSAEFDVPDGRSGILYPKGYTFNPLDYLSLPNILVFIDGDDRKQVAWFKSSPYHQDIRTMLLLTGGSYVDLAKELKMPVFYASVRVAERFGLRAVPSVAVQKGNAMEVREYALEPELK